MNKKAQYKSLSGKTSSRIDWVFYMQELEDTDWMSAEKDVEDLILRGQLVEVKK